MQETEDLSAAGNDERADSTKLWAVKPNNLLKGNKIIHRTEINSVGYSVSDCSFKISIVVALRSTLVIIYLEDLGYYFGKYLSVELLLKQLQIDLSVVCIALVVGKSLREQYLETLLNKNKQDEK